jgi:hypothetical protein
MIIKRERKKCCSRHGPSWPIEPLFSGQNCQRLVGLTPWEAGIGLESLSFPIFIYKRSLKTFLKKKKASRLVWFGIN